MTNYLEIGKITNTFGIKGFVKIQPLVDDMSRFEELRDEKAIIYIETRKETIEKVIEEVKFQNKLVLVKFNDVDDIDTAERFKNCYIKIDRKNAKKLPKGTYFIADLIGMDVVTEDGKHFGKLLDIYKVATEYVYDIKTDEGKEVVLPGRKDVILEINLEEEKIKVHLLEGLV